MRKHKLCLSLLYLCLKPHKFGTEQFALHFCWVGHCTRTKNSPQEGESEASLAGGYPPVVSELWRPFMWNLRKSCSSASVFCGESGYRTDPYSVLGVDYHWEVVIQVLHPFLDIKGQFHRKAQEKISNIINPVEFQLFHIPGYTLLDGNKEKYLRVSFLKLPACVCAGSVRAQVGKKIKRSQSWDYSTLEPGLGIFPYFQAE